DLGQGLAWGINDSGQVVGGFASPGGDTWGDVWTESGGIQYLPITGARGINDSGQVVGGSRTGLHASLWTDGVLIDLGTLGGRDRSVATGINNLGQVVGYSYPAMGGIRHACMWIPATPPTWPSGSSVTATDVDFTSMTLTWTAAKHNTGVAQYLVYQDGTLIVTVDGNVRTHQVTGLEPETYYTFKVDASDVWGTTSTDGPALTVRTLTPAEAIWQLIGDVMDMNLQQGIENSLDAKLYAAFQALDDVDENNDVAAVNSLRALINAVEYQRGNIIPESDAVYLIEVAQEIIDQLLAG
ncbi:MAG: fibronectin type III domain-containing protein, partial [Planctomycetota bacterium]